MDIYLFSLLLGFLGLTAMALAGFIGHGHDGTGHMHAHDGAGGHLAGHDAGAHLGIGHGHDAFGHDLGAGHAGGHDLAAGHGHAGGHDLAAAGHGHAGGHDLAPGTHVHADGTVHADSAHAGHAHGHDNAAPSSVGNAILNGLIAWLSPRVIFGVLVGFGAAGLLLRNHVPAPLTVLLAVACAFLFELGVIRPIWGFMFRFAGEPSNTLQAIWMETATATTAFDATGDGLVRVELNGEVRQILARLRPEDRQSGVRVRMGDQLRVEDVDPERNECVVSWLGRGETPEV